jgi:hypothetical protein
MRVWAIGDLHLAHAVDKPMDIFGAEWVRHDEKIAANWRDRVADEDIVLIPGDLSWALKLEDAVPDIEWVGALPGEKYLIKGNHDPWWGSRSKVARILPDRMHLVQYDAHEIGDGIGLTGTRGWALPGAPDFDPERDDRILAREVGRLRHGLEALAKTACEKKIVMLHYPPLWPGSLDTPFSEVLAAHRVGLCLYGHLHGADTAIGFEGEHDSVRYRLVSADHIGFTPVEVRA